MAPATLCHQDCSCIDTRLPIPSPPVELFLPSDMRIMICAIGGPNRVIYHPAEAVREDRSDAIATAAFLPRSSDLDRSQLCRNFPGFAGFFPTMI
ncbi:Hypothetical protein NTJ_10941 [Nesidiocoris tenuis]|uniref:Uncharacterized protein n=1 Tax=Nesidiocoris tenuis TaxID=355587 RepID=A0ABN7B127_9HEMI|nr:Hypothetical protein NTJ_10941 [Nesidiocoris tenuis]